MIARGAAAGQPLAVSRGLEALREALEAALVTLVRFDHESASFEVVGATGRPFLAPRVTLPLTASMIVFAASEGRSAHLSAGRSWYPLDRVTVSLGLRGGLVIPLPADEEPLGALAVGWEVDPPPVSDPTTVVGDREAELLELLANFDSHQRTVLVCHEDGLLAGGLARVLECRLGAAVATAHTVDDARAALATWQPDLIVCSDRLSPDAQLPDVARELRDAHANTPLLALVRTDSPQRFESALEAGATGYVTLATAAEELPEAAAALFEGLTVLPPTRTAASGPRLTLREHEVLMGFDRGLADKQIARELEIAISTVKSHARAIYAKLDATSRTAALHKAREVGLL